jgi:hypothetical protein
MAWALIAILLFALLPIISVMVSSGIASLASCQLNEAASHSCVVLGVDIGGLLTLMFVAGWLALATVPAGGAALLIWILIAIVLVFRARRAKGRA